MTMIYARSRPQVRNFAADMGWDRPRSRGHIGSRPRALNASSLPLQVTSGQAVYVARARFEYQGPAAFLQLGVGWKTGNFNFDHGVHLIRPGDGGYNFSNAIEMPAFSTFGWVEVFFTAKPLLLAPVIGQNIRVDGSAVSYVAGTQIDAWIWMYDTGKMGFSKTSPDTDFLVIDNDTSVIQLKSSVSAQQVRSLDVEYTL